MFISFEFISGVAIGTEFVFKREIGESDEGWYLIIDLLIFRIVVDK